MSSKKAKQKRKDEISERILHIEDLIAKNKEYLKQIPDDKEVLEVVNELEIMKNELLNNKKTGINLIDFLKRGKNAGKK